MNKTDEILKKYNSRIDGLNSQEVQNRQEKYGLNELEETKKTSSIIKFLKQFTEPLIILLIIAAIAAYFIGDVIDSIVILIVVSFNAIIGYHQEHKAEKAMEELKNIVTTKAIVKREGKKSQIDGKYLTLGDIVNVEEGDKVPADIILLSSVELKIDESSITGESKPVNKNSDYSENDDIEKIDGANRDFEDKILYMESTVVSGRGTGLVFNIGMNTSMGKIAKLIQEDSDETPLQQKIGKLGKYLGAIAVIICILVFILQMFKGMGLVENFMTAVSLAVAAIPEGLPAVLTLTLALGMQRMAKSNAIIRKLLAVETLGSCNIICSDKTGTLTLNQMTVRDSEIYSNKAFECAYLCNNAILKDDDILGNPTDGAALVFADKSDYPTSTLSEKLPRLGEIPLTSTRKMMTTLHAINKNNENIENNSTTDRLDDGKFISYTKGAPEIVLNLCKYIDDNGTIKIIDDKIKENILSRIEEMSNNSLRVLALTYNNIDIDLPQANENNTLDLQRIIEEETLENELTLCGIIGIMDPPKENAKEAVAKCKSAGIRVIMITGDHKDTASAIAKELGILNKGKVLTGIQLNQLSDEEYLKICDDVEVYARVYPEQKVRIVETLKSKDNVVSMTGDGVNDAPALKKASIGVAMGNGTDVAKESADMVLQDNDFTTIVKAIEEGRKIFDNIRRFVKFQISTNVGAILTIVIASILNMPLPFNPIQILWINIIMDGPPAQSLGAEGPERNIMNRESENGEILNKKDILRILITGLIMAAGTLLVFGYELSAYNNLGYKSSLTKAMTVAFTIFVIYQLFSAINNRADTDEKNKAFTSAIIGSFILQLLVVYVGPLQLIFRTTAIGLIDWVLIFVVASSIFLGEYIMRKTFLKNPNH
ncbi:cation-translocating P-type ATPase [uncultured Methanobrevibacter sp.]|uniref:cation-translocating P-type ATPase n=1 Tax=uncultured Methanobrevibacter sp. TaxID=253161 RepID=UPI0025F31828|nr:cation-translocating P-type ATPase [uncultured Methanobrevibacter sp.]